MHYVSQLCNYAFTGIYLNETGVEYNYSTKSMRMLCEREYI